MSGSRRNGEEKRGGVGISKRTTSCVLDLIEEVLNFLVERELTHTHQPHTSVEVIVGLIHTYRRDTPCLNNSVMDTIIICPEAVIRTVI